MLTRLMLVLILQKKKIINKPPVTIAVDGKFEVPFEQTTII